MTPAARAAIVAAVKDCEDAAFSCGAWQSGDEPPYRVLFDRQEHARAALLRLVGVGD